MAASDVELPAVPGTWDDYGLGTHDWPYWRRDLRETLPDLVRVLARA